MIKSDVEQLTLAFLHSSVTITDLIEEMEGYETTKPAWLDEYDHDYYQACKNAILLKALTGR